jgi:hypothetical protein
MATAHDNAAEAKPKTTISPSPRLFTSIPRFGEGLAQDSEVPSAYVVGGLGRQTLSQLGGAHHVGEQNGHVLGRQWSPPAWWALGVSPACAQA